MQTYSYNARDSAGKLMRGTLAAENEIDLANKLNNLGQILVRAKPIATPTGKAVTAKIGRMVQKDVLNFTIYLSTLFDAGVPLVASLQALGRDAEEENIQHIVDDIRSRVESGSTLREALAFHPQTFSPLYIAIVGAGENTGKLSGCLADLAYLLEWQMELRAKVKEAAMYPTILFFVMIGVVTLLVMKVIPTFEPIFQAAGATLPLPTQIVLGISHLTRKFWYIPVGLILFSVFAYKVYYSSVNGKYTIDSLKLKLPLIGTLIHKIALSRFCRTFSISLKSGIAVLNALDISCKVINNSRLERSIVKVRDSVNVGEKLVTAFQSTGDFPPLVVRMVGVGEQSGDLVGTLSKVNKFYDRDVPVAIRKMFVLFEPLMIVFMGVVVGGIALAIFLPLFKMTQVIGG